VTKQFATGENMTRVLAGSKRNTVKAMVWLLVGICSLCAGGIAIAQDTPPDIDCANPPAGHIQPDAETVQVSDLVPVALQPAEAALKPGLAVRYYFKKSRNLKTIPSESSAQKSKVGEPIPYLNHQFGRGEVFGSGTNRLVMMRMKGMLHLPQAGKYTFRALSNDGVQVYLGGQMMIRDPRGHSDRCSHLAEVEIVKAGWYELTVEYFQRKGTAALRFYWQPPGADALSIVPAEAYGHQ